MGDVRQTVGVLIATYQRPRELCRCLTALEKQSHPVDDVLLILREDDALTRAAVQDFSSELLAIRIITVLKPGSVAARNAGLDACKTDFLAIIDDDTAPHVDWLARVMGHFRNDPLLGGVGGRDRCFIDKAFNDSQEAVVGKIQWFGRVVGNHHLGFGELREVDVLKGANMTFRAEAFADVRFDTRLKGNGAQSSEDYCFSIAVKCNGWKLAYDPMAVVDHYLSPRAEARHYIGVARVEDDGAFRDYAYNQVLSIWNGLSGSRRFVFVLWSSLVGTGIFPGFVQAIRFTPRLGIHSWRRFIIAQQGKMDAIWDLLFYQRDGAR